LSNLLVNANLNIKAKQRTHLKTKFTVKKGVSQLRSAYIPAATDLSNNRILNSP